MLLIENESGTRYSYKLHNEHPELSWSALWSKVWYESYPEPDYVWQSSASTNDFEPKYSFAPLAFGTLKAAFYAMLIAAPLAICGAIYTAYCLVLVKSPDKFATTSPRRLAPSATCAGCAWHC